MGTEDFENLVVKHSLHPTGKLYAAMALAGEVGEVCNNEKKIVMAQMNPEWVTQETNPLMGEEFFQEQLIEELGDVLFYLTRVALNNGATLAQLMVSQQVKLAMQSNKYQRIFLK